MMNGTSSSNILEGHQSRSEFNKNCCSSSTCKAHTVDVIVYTVYIIVKMYFTVNIDDNSATAVFGTATSSGRSSAILAAGRLLSLAAQSPLTSYGTQTQHIHKNGTSFLSHIRHIPE
eukprot:scaffold75016_cov46-Cyclotella_meneghiniana.AAC.4